MELAQRGVRKLTVICPAFVADCVELELVPCINDHPAWIDVLAGWVAAFEKQGEIAFA